jgi:hypothetical protein
MVKEMEQSSGIIKGYIIYREESEEELKKQKEEQEKIKDLIKQSMGEDNSAEPTEEDETAMNEQTAAIIKKFKGKILKEFVPFFILSQYKEELNIEYESFEICVDEYFSQAVKQKEVTKI